MMGSLPPLSVIQGDQDILRRKDEPILLHRIIEHTIQSIESINNNNEKIPTIHGINLRGGEPCFVCGDKRLSLGEVNERANQLARSIQQNCVPVANNDKDIVISVEMKPSIELVMTLMAIWKAGAAYLPLDEAFPDDRVRHIISESKPSLLITDRGDNPIRFRGCNVTTFQNLWAEAQDLHTENLPDESSWMKKVHEEDRVCAILYTSGSTGVPKGVRLPHCTVVQRLKWQWKEYPFSPTEDFCLFKTALTFVDSIPELWGAVLAGKSILILQKSDVIDIQQFVETLDQYKVERIILVPSLLRSLLFYIGVSCNEKTPFRANEIVKRNQLTNLKIVVCSGETLPVQLAQKFYQFFPEKEATLLNFFGSTETMGDVLYYPVPNGEKLANCKVIPIGRPMYNCNIYLLDKNMRPVRKGTVGELYASGAHIALGYVNNREPERFLQNSFSSDPVHSKLYRTGDYARWENDVILYEGRTDSQIKIRGHKVDLSEVSSALAKIPLVEKYAVLCYNAGQIDQALVAFITAKKVGASANEIEEQLEAKLPPYMIPNIQMVDQIPLLVNGKVDRQTLLREYGASRKNQAIQADFDFNGIRQEFIKKAKAVFEAVAATLGGSLKKRIDAATDYYSLGGNSLNSIIAVTTLKDLGYSISIGDFVKAQNMLEIIEKIEEEEKTVEISMESLSKIDEGKYTIEIVRDDLKEDVIRIITESFFERGDLERCISGIKREDYRELVEALWSSFMEQQLSYVVKTSSGESVACALNLDANLEPELHLKDNNLTIIFTFLEHVEGPFRENVLPKGTGQIFHSSMMGTAAGISTQQNVELMMFMEHQNMEMARKKGFAGVFTTNTSPLTQQLGTDVFKFKVLRDYQANKYVAEDGTRPFETGPNSLRAVVSWKPIN